MQISVFGLGYVGSVTLGCLANDGHDVIGVDIDERKLDLIRSGQSPVIEEGIQELIASGVENGRVSVTTDTAAAIQRTDVSFVCVGTPSNANGSQDLTAIDRLSAGMGEALKSKSTYHVIVVRSTVLPGTVEGRVQPVLSEKSGKTADEDFGLCFQPEFLREGSAVKDYYDPPFTVIGCGSDRPMSMLREIHENLPCELFQTTIPTAEMLKYCCNGFHALKITFANEVGRMCQGMGVDSQTVMDLVCRDTNLNISRAYLRPGFAFGGSCLPKDLRALVQKAFEKNVQVPMLASILPSNKVHVEHALEMILGTGQRSAGMIGLSFKSGTDDVRESPLVILAEQLIGKGFKLRIYDPEVSYSKLIGANRRYIEETIPHLSSLMCPRCEDLIDESPVLIVGLNDPDLVTLVKGKARSDQTIVDLVGMPDGNELPGTYCGVCW